MNKLTKGAIATAAGIVLLMGGAGTLAYWNGSATVLATGSAVSSGQLTVTPLASPASAWSVLPKNGASTPVSDITAFRLVPGDTLTYNKSVQVVATGTTLKVQLSLAPGSITSADNALKTELTDAASLSISGALPTGVTASGTPGVYNVAPGTYTLPILVNIDWDDAGTPVAGSENTAENLTVSFGAFAVNVSQVFS